MSLDSFNGDWLVDSPHYAGVMNDRVLPWLREREKVSVVPGYNGRPLHTVRWQADNPVGTVLVLHGFTENTVKYSELIWSLLHNRFSVVIYDQRGHGFSWRDERIPDSSVTHVERFGEYVEDLKAVCETLLPGMPKPWFLFAHSMGGAVASCFLEEHTDVFAAAVLSAPMIEPNLNGIPAPLAAAVASAAVAFGRGVRHPFFMKPYSGPEDFSTSCATDPDRFGWYEEVREAEPAFHNSVPSYRWSLESLKVRKRILAPGAPERIACPVLLFSAELDANVLPGPQEAFIARVRNGSLVRVPEARHEISRSRNVVLFPWWRRVLDFYLDNTEASIRRKGET